MDIIKIEHIFASKDTIRNVKRWLMENFLHIIYLIRNIYLEYIVKNATKQKNTTNLVKK